MADVAGTLITGSAKDRFLILRRPDGSWDLPKGIVKGGESIARAAVRETHEETGLSVRLTSDLRRTSYKGDDIWIFAARQVGDGKVTLSGEHTDYGWVSRAKASSILFPPLAKIVEKLSEGQVEMEDTLSEEIEKARDGATACGVFLPVPFDLAKDFPDKWRADDSVPHLTLLFAGKLKPSEHPLLLEAVRKVCLHLAPFEMDLAQFSEFTNNEGQRIPHMKPSCRAASRLARIHGMLRRAAEAEGLKIAHTYGPRDNAKVPYEVRFTPHATLAYIDGACPYDGPKPTGSWKVTELEVWGHEKSRVPLGHNVYDQPSGARRDPLSIRYPMAVPEPMGEGLDLARTPLLLTELRESCLNCIRKHLGQAAALMDEAKQGYKAHRWLAIGHLGEAASEALKEHPKLADVIREHRVRYIDDPDYSVPVMDLIKQASRLVSEHCGYCEKHKDQLKGGLADKNQPSDFDPEQLRMGIEVEREHTKDPAIAREIASDHLKEIPDYYTRLAKLEKSAGTKHESVTSLQGYEAHGGPGGGSSPIGAGPRDSLRLHDMMKDEERKKRLRKLGLERTPL